MSPRPIHLLTFSCQDRPGIVAAVAGAIAEAGGNILESAQFGDVDTGRFFMRMRFDGDGDRPALERALAPVIERFAMDWSLADEAARRRAILMVSKMDHCLRDLLYRRRRGDLRVEVVAIVSNHPDCRPLAEAEGLPFHHWPVTPETKAEQEQRLIDLVEAEGVELVVLARYMQILSDTASKRLFGKAINIHHSFLPSFKGAKPYHQAHARGVKLIGATAHYVTADLDEGPIVEQEVERVHHAMTPDDLVAAGRDIESRVLARAVNLHLEQRVLLNGAKTVVFT